MTKFIQYLTRSQPLYIALYTAAGEVKGGSYERRLITFNSKVNPVYNAEPVEFPVATAAWGTVTHYGIFTRDGEQLVYGEIAGGRTVKTDDFVKFNVGAITITEGGSV